MIIRESNGGHILITQPDHARASSQIARALDKSFFCQKYTSELIELVAHHDDGWIDWEAAPQLLKSGQPINFLDVEAKGHEEIWRQGIEMAEHNIGYYAAAVLGRHAQSLVSSPSFSDYLSERIASAARSAMPGEDSVVRDWHIERGLHLLQFCDVLTLIVCAGWDQELHALLLDEEARRMEIAMKRTAEWEIGLDEWPFTNSQVRVEIPLIRIENENWTAALDAVERGIRAMQPMVIRPLLEGRMVH